MSFDVAFQGVESWGLQKGGKVGQLIVRANAERRFFVLSRHQNYKFIMTTHSRMKEKMAAPKRKEVKRSVPNVMLERDKEKDFIHNMIQTFKVNHEPSNTSSL